MEIFFSIFITALIVSLIFIAYIKYKYKTKDYEHEKQKRENELQRKLQQKERNETEKLQQYLKQKKEEYNKEILEHKESEKQKFEELKEEYALNYEQYIKYYEDKKNKKFNKIKDVVQSAAKDAEEELNQIHNNAKEQEQEIIEHLNDLKSKEKAAIQARIREYEEQNKEEFYKIQISSEDLQDIGELEAILPKLKNERALRKAIYSIYYLDAVKDLATRLTGGRKLSGIYKITNPTTGECYIGQSVDIERRIRDHTKRGSGASEATSNKLYPVLQEKGIHHFKYEIVEEVEQAKLSEREKYWQEYFGAKIFGYSKA